MTNHNFQPICEEDPALMCTECYQCKCCQTPTDECPGEPDIFLAEPSEEAKRALREWRDGKMDK